ncbi:alpha/beta hydrolase [Paralcaligenes sp. KSB-10]|uniref:alpha/beta hydrolase n=1 Tax=Paralcaligenes sp. KSB-10 TaxID=2901142 RepID=UPI001E2A0851|nr:alpha/beta hydrolase [Paralcaligenes sp. KSB-10]UHL62778.1 alpha/beta hydrolase [Paralcaligenes sp. KSB-10]
MNAPHQPTDQFDFSSIDNKPRIDAAECRLFTACRARSAAQPAFLFVAGAYHGAWCYSHYLDYFAQHHINCFAIDLPGHGTLYSASTPVSLGINDLGTHLVQACRTLNQALILVGHSMGALPVMLAAAGLPLAGMVLLAPSPPGNLPHAQALPAVATDRLKAAPNAAEIRKRFLAVEANRDVAAIVQRLTPESPTILNDRYLLRVDIDSRRIQCPGICFEAELDTPDRHPEGQDKAIADFLGIQHQLLKQQPHCMMYGDRWIDSAAALLAWYRITFPDIPASA